MKTFTFYKTAWWREKGYNGLILNSNKQDPEKNPIFTGFDASDPELKYPKLLVIPICCFLIDKQGFIIGDAVRYWSTRSQEERKKAIIAQYAREFGASEALSPVYYADKNWLEEEYSRGCYVGVMSPGTLTTCGKALREPVGRIHWAGTETAEVWAGYMEGAVER